MDELVKALAEAVRTGTAYAWPVLLGYYITNVVRAALGVACVISVVVIVCRTVRYSTNRTCEADEANKRTQAEYDLKRCQS